MRVPVVEGDAGSSPLTRGKRQEKNPRENPPWLIPAHAGKTCQPHTPPTRVTAHPRSRGENFSMISFRGSYNGSSPLTRGKLTLVFYHSFSSRLIPAHAGKTHAFDRGRATHAAHPRSRGENLVCCVLWGVYGGSSPLTRGKLHREPGRNRTCRLIPAHAGKT